MEKPGTNDYDFLNSLSEAQLATLLNVPSSLGSSSQKTERKVDQERKAASRAAARDLIIHVPQDPIRRNDCLANPELFLTTYFQSTFYQPFTPDRLAMLESIVDAAKYGGDFALAGPRGEGKTRLAMYGACYLMFSMLSPFPVVIGKSQTKSQNELKTIKEQLQQNELLIADFPEVGVPFQSVGGWSSRARMQTVSGKNTNMELAADHLIFPTIERWQLPSNWPSECEPVSKGQIMSSLGIDGPIRGTNYRDRRPTLAILDDIESKDSADSDVTIGNNEEIIEKDIGGLGAGGRRVSRVMLCTTQNRKCIAYKYTDRGQKPSWNGRRFRKMIVQPDKMDMWQQYIELRVNRDGDTDPNAREAFRYYKANQSEMDAGCEISNPYSFDTREAPDGEPIELSAIHAYFNRVADFGPEAVATEDDNDPPETVGPQGAGLTANVVTSRLSGLDRCQLPANTASVTAAIDLGKYQCHWVIAAWWKGAGGCIVDYGVAEVHGTDSNIDNEESEPQIYKTLLNWREELLQKKLVDASGAERNVDSVFVDAGTFTNAAYKFVKDVGGQFHAAKGIGNYRERKKSTATTRAGDNMHAELMQRNNLWLFELNTDYWKQWVHERFLAPTFDDENMLRKGALSLFNLQGHRKHLSFAQHIVSEELVTEFKEGKGAKTFWMVHNRNNHWLDATYNAAAAARFTGINLLTNQDAPKITATPIEAAKQHQKVKRRKHGNFRSRPGGWVKGMR